MKLNLGSGNYPLEGWTNVDAHCPADITGDFREMEFSDVDAVNMSHVLEHISWRETLATLARIRSWMVRGATLTIEVPDIDVIVVDMAREIERDEPHPLRHKYLFGDQSHDGEQHLAGFSGGRLAELIEAAGFRVGAIVRFRSEHKGRETMPCLKAQAYA